MNLTLTEEQRETLEVVCKTALDDALQDDDVDPRWVADLRAVLAQLTVNS